MTGPPATDLFASARDVADAVLYEGYVLYPYRASSNKNQTRWQFGVLMPPAFVADDPSERSRSCTEIVFEPKADSVLTVQLRFLHVQHRSGGDAPEWDEVLERTVEVSLPVAQLRAGEQERPFAFAGETSVDGQVRRTSRDVRGALVVSAFEVPGPFGALRLRIVAENRTGGTSRNRDVALRGALVAAHSMYALDRGHFLSMTDPPEWAAPEVARCVNEGTWPVLAGSESVVLSSPIILGDHPEIAPESPGTLYDGTEIDEILTLRTMTLTDAEKAEARATDPRAAAVIDQVDGLPPEQLDRLHGALRYLRQVTGPAERATPDEPPTLATPTACSPTDDVEAAVAVMNPQAPWWDPGADASVSPDTDAVLVDGVRVSRGSRVRIRPGGRRTDAQDLFMHGRTATVEAVFFDVDGKQHLGVTPDDDAELADIQRAQGRFLYFAPDEVEPVPS